ncbi:MAG: Adenosylcobinamide-GDP ribazoletransferase [uncultured Thiotrichaceae bacterium]|uniref:Adenosylcobinamide-GDP ribazoletransferase n=1 Tax=uncultured Thiotrichaceae bacterium TaxID=298394 RepID=A0A6S6SLG3_9GAMM|nr:MAG: Adenosylcobinamide-GDP ribazoletransferase [uncultured Thiotrichaceae bacterium]
MLSFMTPFLLALSLLTRIPVPDFKNEIQAQQIGRSTLFYPFVGLVIGTLLSLTVWILPATQHTLLIASIITVLWIMITGGIHLDGLADSADAWLGGFGDHERTQRIMKDPLVGAAGVIAIVALVLLKVTALDALLQQQFLIALLVSPIIGRGMILLLFLTTPYIRKEGMANDATSLMPRNGALIALTLVFILGFTVSIIAMLATLIMFYLLRRLMMKRLHGCTGDTAGATVEIIEMVWLATVVLF